MIPASRWHALRLPGFRALWTDGEAVVGARGYRLCRLDREGREEPLGSVPAPLSRRLLTRVRVTRLGLRLGIHNAWPLRDGSIVTIVSKAIWKLELATGRRRLVERIRHGNKPGFNGLVVCPDGRVFYGEYSLNPGRDLALGVYRSEAAADSFRQVYEFPAGSVRHIHFIQWDPFAACLWMGTGDRNEESRLLTSTDGGSTWESVGEGTQLWRAVGVVFTPEAVYWGTDAGSDAGDTPNVVVRWDRRARRADTIQPLQGPCHGITKLAEGTILLATGVEGGQNEHDRQSHLWRLSDGEFREIAAWKKDFWPAVVQFGVVRFPHGLEESQKPCLVLLGLKGQGEATWIPEWPLHE